MRPNLLRRTAFVLVCLAAVRFGGDIRALAQMAPVQSRVEPHLSVTVEVFCSETKLRTSNARIHWSAPRATLEASGLRSLAAGKQYLEATVFKGGFDKGLLVSVPISQATPERPVAAQAQDRKSKLRAFQFSLIEVEPPRGPVSAETSEMGAVVEDLEPGVNYTWRVAIDTASGRIVSPSATSEALTCPADMVGPTSVPKRRKP